MKPHHPEPANDRDDLSAGQHLRLCAEMRFVRGLIKQRIINLGYLLAGRAAEPEQAHQM